MENNQNIDELVMQAITENLQNINQNLQNTNQKLQAIEEKAAGNSNAELYKDLHRISQTMTDMNKNLDYHQAYIKALPRQDYTSLFTETKDKLSQFTNDFNKMVVEIRIPFKHKLIAFSVIGVLVILLIISIFKNVQMNDQLQPAQKNDLKYRYMKSLGDDELVEATIYTDSIFNQFEHESIRESVEKREELIRQKTNADMRAKYAEEEASKLRKEAENLEKLKE